MVVSYTCSTLLYPTLFYSTLPYSILYSILYVLCSLLSTLYSLPYTLNSILYHKDTQILLLAIQARYTKSLKPAEASKLY